MTTGASHAAGVSRLREVSLAPRNLLAAKLALIPLLAAVAMALAPAAEARPIVAVVGATLGAIFLLPAVGRMPSFVWAPVLGAIAVTALPALGIDMPHVEAAALVGDLLAHLYVPILILALAYSSISLDDSGFFDWCSLRIMRLGRGDGERLLVAVFLSVSVITFFTSNDIVILAMTPILLHLGRNAHIRNLTPFLMAQFVAANTASMGLYIGNPTNIVIGSAAGLGFVEYARRMLVPTAIATVTALLVVWFIFSRLSRQNRIPDAYEVPNETRDGARWTRAMTIKVTIFGACLAALGTFGNPIAASALLDAADPAEIRRGVSMLIVGISIAFALCLLGYDTLRDVRRNTQGTKGTKAALFGRMKRLPIEIVPFFLGFCVLLRSIEAAGLSRMAADRIEQAFRAGPLIGSLATGVYGIGAVNILNNIPATLLFEKLWLGDPSTSGVGLEARLESLHPAAADIFVDASLFASNFGANLTFTGALAGLMWLRILRDSTSTESSAPRVPSPKEFVVYGLIVVPVVTFVTCAGIALWRIGLG